MSRNNAQKKKFSIKDFSSKCDLIRSFLRNWSHLLKKSLMENVFFVQCKFCRGVFRNQSSPFWIRPLIWSNPSKENELLFKSQRNKCVSLQRNCIKTYFQDVAKKVLVINMSLGKFVNHFMLNVEKWPNIL